MASITQTLTESGTFTAPEDMLGDSVVVVAAGGEGGTPSGDTSIAGGGGSIVQATVPLAAGETLTITIGEAAEGSTPGTGFHNGGTGTEAGGGSTGVQRSSSLEIEAGGGGGAAASGTTGDGGAGGWPSGNPGAGSFAGTGGVAGDAGATGGDGAVGGGAGAGPGGAVATLPAVTKVGGWALTGPSTLIDPVNLGDVIIVFAEATESGSEDPPIPAPTGGGVTDWIAIVTGSNFTFNDLGVPQGGIGFGLYMGVVTAIGDTDLALSSGGVGDAIELSCAGATWSVADQGGSASGGELPISTSFPGVSIPGSYGGMVGVWAGHGTITGASGWTDEEGVLYADLDISGSGTTTPSISGADSSQCNAWGVLQTQAAGGGAGGGASFVAEDTSDVSLIGTNAGAGYASVTYQEADEPLAPTLVAPANNSWYDAEDNITTFQGTYNPDADSGTLSEVAFRIKTASGSYYYWNGTELVDAIAWVAPSTGVGAGVGGTFQLAIPASILSDPNTYSWNFATQEDSFDLEGPFAATDFVLNAAVIPEIAYTAPGATSPTVTPTVSWTDSLQEGDSQVSYHAMVYSEAQVNAAGFTAGSSAPIWDGLIQESASTSFEIPSAAGLEDLSTYWVYVQIVETGGNTSQWTGQQFEVVLDAPQVPSLVVVPSANETTGNPANQFTVEANDNWLTAVDSSFETGIGSWTGVGCTLSTDASWSDDGIYSLKLTATAIGTMAAHTNERIPVAPLQQVWAYGVAHDQGTAELVSLKVHFYDDTDTFIEALVVASADDTSGEATLIGSCDAPSNAATFDVGVAIPAASIGEAHNIDCMGGYLNGEPSAWSLGGFIGFTEAEVQSSRDEITWTDCRWGIQLPLVDQQGSQLDEEAPFNVPTYYRARVVAYIEGQVIPSAWCAPVSCQLDSDNWWVSIPTDQGLIPPPPNKPQNVQLPSAVMLWRAAPVLASTTTVMVSGDVTASLGIDRPEQQGIFQAVGRSTAIVTRGAMQDEQFGLTMQWLTDLAYQIFDAIRCQQLTVLLRSDMDGDIYYVALGASRPAVILRTSDRRTNPQRQLAVVCTPVTIP